MPNPPPPPQLSTEGKVTNKFLVSGAFQHACDTMRAKNKTIETHLILGDCFKTVP